MFSILLFGYPPKVYINNSLYYINPLLNILGYKFFDVEYKELGSNEVKSAKFFHRGDRLEVGKRCLANVKNQHFCFIGADNCASRNGKEPKF